jgi:hypothetical protein
MARSSGLSYDQVAHATAWYLRHETLTAAIDDVVNYYYHHHLPATALWGTGPSPPPTGSASRSR